MIEPDSIYYFLHSKYYLLYSTIYRHILFWRSFLTGHLSIWYLCKSPMSKRKTKKQKIQSETRLQKVNLTPVVSKSSEEQPKNISTYSYTHSPSVQKSSSENTPDARYTYVVHDVRQTLIILSIIVLLNSFLYFLIQRNIIRIAW